jgi:hypothetical protein
MGLPKIDVLTHEVTIPSSNEIVKIRPFLVKEQKMLLSAMAGENTEDITNATKQVITNCVLTENFNVDKLQIFDLEYLILQLRIISIGETATIRFKPRQNTECVECLKYKDVEINLKEAKINLPENLNRRVELTDTVGLIMNYPDAKFLSKIYEAKKGTDIEKIFKVIWLCVDSIYDETNITSSKDVTLKEGMEFLESLSGTQFSKIETFLRNIPKLEQTIKVSCKTCTFQEDFVISGLDSFFG